MKLHMKKLLYLLIISILIFYCNKPVHINQDGEKYKLVNWEGGLFVYVTYHWKGGKFDDAVQLERDFVQWADSADITIQAIGRFPTSKVWQLGFISKSQPEANEFKSYSIETMQIPSGTYASLYGKGHPENMFWYWKKLKKWLIREGQAIDSPVFEIYNDLFTDSIPDKERIGEIRYRLGK